MAGTLPAFAISTSFPAIVRMSSGETASSIAERSAATWRA
jgi:hypothetical protein